MKFVLNKDKLLIQETQYLNSGSIEYYEIPVEYDESWNNLSKEAILIKAGESTGKSIAIINDKIYIDQDTKGSYSIGFVGYTIENDVKTYQISTRLKTIFFAKGAGEIEVENSSEVPTPTEWEIYIAQIQSITSEINGLANELNNKVTEVEEKLDNGDFDGKDGIDGHTPVKGVDYFTEEDITEVRNGLQEEITSSNKLKSDLIDDTNQTNKFVTTTEKTIWNNKSDFSGSYNDLTDKPIIPKEPIIISEDFLSLTEESTEQEIYEAFGGKENLENIVSYLLEGIPLYVETVIEDEETDMVSYAGYTPCNYYCNASSEFSYDITFILANNSNNQYTLSVELDSEDLTTIISVSYNGFDDFFVIYDDVLTKYNTDEYEPTDDYNPATKKYVDDMVGNIEVLLGGI